MSNHTATSAGAAGVERLISLLSLLILWGFAPTAALAQGSACTITPYADPPREVLRCRDGLEISAERSADYALIDNNRDGRPEGARLTGKGLMIDLRPGRAGGFRILTPHAIAAARGTVWAVDVTPSATSVFVSRGTVAVQRTGTSQPVLLRAGDGVDVDAGAQPLQVKRWSSERAALLLGRFGR